MILNFAAAEEALLQQEVVGVPMPKFLRKETSSRAKGCGTETNSSEGVSMTSSRAKRYGTDTNSSEGVSRTSFRSKGCGTDTNSSEGHMEPAIALPESNAGVREEENCEKNAFKWMQQRSDGDSRWWTKSRTPLACPLTQLPISLLPYPPFKLCVNPQKPSPRKLVDGKYLALQIIVNGQYEACGRLLQQCDIKDIDDYIHRCKLGPFRPGKAMALAKVVETAKEPEQKKKAMQELKQFRAAARAELGKLRRIQESRLMHLGLTPGGADGTNDVAT